MPSALETQTIMVTILTMQKQLSSWQGSYISETGRCAYTALRDEHLCLCARTQAHVHVCACLYVEGSRQP